MDVSTFNLPPSSPSWDSSSARAVNGQTEANEQQAADKAAKATADKTTADKTTAEETDQPQSEATRFSSPVIGVDAGTGSTILEYRNQNTGVPYAQVPSQAALQYAEAVATSPVGRSVQQIEANGDRLVRPGGNLLA
ncbi:hypothetical protein [Phaeospirillum tilakii]|uniref:Uncharacterized protein n=1 Tax=Phaeospirillum tilakii TaxID=741673 RepID=A0ABW5CE79_9PROT